jgi:hypothetical protein
VNLGEKDVFLSATLSGCHGFFLVELLHEVCDDFDCMEVWEERKTPAELIKDKDEKWQN